MNDVFTWLSASTPRTAEDCARLFAGWQIHYYEVGGVKLAAVIQKGNEVHCVVAPEHRGKTIRRGNLREFMRPILEAAGDMLTTRVLHTAQEPQMFVRRIGFTWMWCDENFDYFALCELPFERGPK